MRTVYLGPDLTTPGETTVSTDEGASIESGTNDPDQGQRPPGGLEQVLTRRIRRPPAVYRDLPLLGKNGPEQVVRAVAVAQSMPSPVGYECKVWAGAFAQRLEHEGISSQILRFEMMSPRGALFKMRTRWNPSGEEYNNHFGVLIDDSVVDACLAGPLSARRFPDYLRAAFFSPDLLDFFPSRSFRKTHFDEAYYGQNIAQAIFAGDLAQALSWFKLYQSLTNMKHLIIADLLENIAKHRTQFDALLDIWDDPAAFTGAITPKVRQIVDQLNSIWPDFFPKLGS